MSRRALALALLVGCTPPPGDDDDIAPASAGWAAPVAQDINPDPDVVEVELEARPGEVEWVPGITTPAFTYDGSSPGPTIEATVGDRLILHFTNALPEETVVHWHGVETPADMDGSHISQPAIPPGGTFRYEFDLLRARTAWYHAHIRSNEQIERGLYGALVVRDPAEDARLGLPADEHVLLLDDVLLDDAGRVAPPWPVDPAERLHVSLNGREGNHLLVNGRTRPRVDVVPGVALRLRLINAANARFMRLSVPGHTLTRVGGDSGLRSSPVLHPPIDVVPDPATPGETMSDPDPAVGLLLVPGERADVVLTPTGAVGDVLSLEWHDSPRGRMWMKTDRSMGILEDDGRAPPEVLAELRLVDGPADPAPWQAPETLAELVPIDVDGTEPITILFGPVPSTLGDERVVMYADPDARGFEQLTSADVPEVRPGDVRVYEVLSRVPMVHPFHTHGFPFQHVETVERNFCEPTEPDRVVETPTLEDKDTIAIPPQGDDLCVASVARLAVRFDDAGREGLILASGKTPTADSSGGWLVHCHFLEHSNLGMATWVEVVE